MTSSNGYSAKGVHEELSKTFHQYLCAQYHIWDQALIEERDRLFKTPGTTQQEPFLETTPIYRSGVPYGALEIDSSSRAILEIAASAKPSTGVPSIPYVHQANALTALLRDDKDLIVATGTGSGKTESFLMPILGALARERTERPESWVLPAVRALLIYPMNALVNDQLSRLRRLLGNAAVAEALKGTRPGNVTFGMYTSRTPYPGKASTSKDEKNIGAALTKLYIDGITNDIRELLIKEGKWPAKDVAAFVERGFKTGADDLELITRHEMQSRAPDVLVSNYSMLEYMMLRPIEAPIFEKTKHWLEKDKRNRLTVVLDEAHMYRGSAGAEVAYLLRRIHSRLGVSRDRVSYILTSASLGTGKDAQDSIVDFANKLTGDKGRGFVVVPSFLEERRDGQSATLTEQSAFASFPYAHLQGADIDIDASVKAFSELAGRLSLPLDTASVSTLADLRDLAYRLLSSADVACLASKSITSSPEALSSIAGRAFPGELNRDEAFDALLALMAFAKDSKSDKPFAPIRSHLFFRGLTGIYACTNSKCSGRLNTPGRLGRLHSTPLQRCECGARVYELLTHRDCGAAFLRGYLTGNDGDFLWHVGSTGTWSDLDLIEAHFYVASGDERGITIKWLHTATGRLVSEKPSASITHEYLAVGFPSKVIRSRGGSAITIEPECPACRRELGDDPKIMDLATKGEAPFAHLVRTQVAQQPASILTTSRSPNAGRKTLLFSDGRQKAARLARDIPREVESDVFRQLLLLASRQLDTIGKEPLLNRGMYASFIAAVEANGLLMFDGTDRQLLAGQLRDFTSIYERDLAEALDAFDPAPAYSAMLLKQLCSSFYSVSALTLAYVAPSKIAMRTLAQTLQQFSAEEQRNLAIQWISKLLSRYAFDRSITGGVRRKAWPYPANGISPKDGFNKRQRDFLSSRAIDADTVCNALSSALCDPLTEGGIYVSPQRVKLDVAIDKPWYQCGTCKVISAAHWWGHCVNCMAETLSPVMPAETSYLRARKGFWRDPVAAVLEGREKPINLNVEEHTAQLSYKDTDTPTPTTEEFERRFRDILVDRTDISIDVLSCTTTMEVGIDIGSLVAVGMRNIPPMRQNYQQRAGRSGRRGSSVSTVMTFAQNGAHDSHYFSNPLRIISGDPPKPVIDADNPRIIRRHIHAQLVQDFFGPRALVGRTGDIFSVLGDTWNFFHGKGPTSLASFDAWIASSPEASDSMRRVRDWLPANSQLDPVLVATQFVASLKAAAPDREDGLEDRLIHFLFDKGLLPSYAFPRDLCALQLEHMERVPRTKVVVDEKPQQGLNVALSEYAPGKLIVVDKKTYRIGTVAASSSSAEVDRSSHLFDKLRFYVHCSTCLFTAGFATKESELAACPQCGAASMQSDPVLTPEVVYPEGGSEVDEYDDEQTFSRATAAQLPLPQNQEPPKTRSFGAMGQIAFEREQHLVMVNQGATALDGSDGFRICDQCGKVLLEGMIEGPHRRDYLIQPIAGRVVPQRCNGEFRRTYLGYSFLSDILLLRFELKEPLRYSLTDRRKRRPMEDALTSLSDALVLALGRVLDVDPREVSAGFRFARIGETLYADIYIHDTSAGGAGYAFQAGQQFGEIFDATESLLSSCNCTASCQNCLRHYGNRFDHEALDRHLALELARYIRLGEIPQALSRDQRIEALWPFADLLRLAGWEVEGDGSNGLLAKSASLSISVDVAPSLLESMAPSHVKGIPHFVFTPYELSRDLASAYAEVV